MIFTGLFDYGSDELDDDIVRYLQTQTYSPSFAPAVRALLEEDRESLREAFEPAFLFASVYADDFRRGVVWRENIPVPRADAPMIDVLIEDAFPAAFLTSGEKKAYAATLRRAVVDNTQFGTLETFEASSGAVLMTAVNGFMRNPASSVYLILCLWCAALQRQNGMDRETADMHANVFANVYLYLKAAETGSEDEEATAAAWILDNSAVLAADSGEALTFFDYPATREALRILRRDGTAAFYSADGGLDFAFLYDFALSVLRSHGIQREDVQSLARGLPPARREFVARQKRDAENRLSRRPFDEREILGDFICRAVAENAGHACLADFESRAPEMTGTWRRYRQVSQVREALRQRVRERMIDGKMRGRNERTRGE
ncbi:MAG: hypothetical protein ACI4PW_00385 [Alphaproteobacteria bacterium]|jgi:hypothetical protein